MARMKPMPMPMPLTMGAYEPPSPPSPPKFQQRKNNADGGKEVSGATAGSCVPKADWKKGEYFDGLDAKQGLIDLSSGEHHFMPDAMEPRAVSDRSYRGSDWALASDAAAEGKPVSMPYKTR